VGDPLHPTPPHLAGWTPTPYALLGEAREVYLRGEGPPVIVMAEVPGITPAVLRFAERVVDAGFTVALPQLFGTPGAPRTPGALARVIARACISHEFTVLARGSASPITRWLRALATRLHAAHGGRGVGAVGMCLTGNFALSLMLEDCVVAPVLSQPSLPFPVSPAHARDVGLSAEELDTVASRAAAGVDVLGLRFSHDALCPAARFDTLRARLGSRFEAHEIDSGPGNAWGHGRAAHSVLTEDLIDAAGQPTHAALERVLAFLRERLHDDGAGGTRG
jgi:dienelactone hydrolase